MTEVSAVFRRIIFTLVLIATGALLGGCPLYPPGPPPMSGSGSAIICDDGMGLYEVESDPGVELYWDGGEFYVGGGVYASTVRGPKVLVKAKSSGQTEDYTLNFESHARKGDQISTIPWRVQVRIPPVTVQPVADSGVVDKFLIRHKGLTPKQVAEVYFEVMLDDGSYQWLEGKVSGLTLAPGESYLHEWPGFGFTEAQVVSCSPYWIGFTDGTSWGLAPPAPPSSGSY